MADFTKLNFPIWGLDNNYYYFVATLIFLFVLIAFSIWLYNKMVKKKIQQSNLKILKTKSIGQAFIGTELSLIQLLLEAASKDMHVEIHQINHVLGIKDKNIGLQKKVRSDVINTINEKYAIIVNVDIPLISSIRKEEDKRFYEYFINEDEIKSIKKILDKK
jgi:cbb3-type cytochrome oxidase subunit 3